MTLELRNVGIVLDVPVIQHAHLRSFTLGLSVPHICPSLIRAIPHSLVMNGFYTYILQYFLNIQRPSLRIFFYAIELLPEFNRVHYSSQTHVVI